MNPLYIFWCCLNPRERAVLSALLLPMTVTPGYIDQAAYAALWASQGYTTTNKLVVTFNIVYGLEEGEVVISEEVVIPVMFPVRWFWPDFLDFSLDVGLLCDAPCKELTFAQ